jgi:urease beta subunit
MKPFVIAVTLLAPALTPGVASASAQTPAPPPAQTMGAFSVQLAQAQVDSQGRIDAIVIVRNETDEAQQITDGTFSVVLQDADGLGIAVTEVHDGAQPTLRRFTALPMVPAGAEQKLRYVVQPLQNGAPVAKLIVREPDRPRAAFDIAHLASAAALKRPAGPTGPGALTTLGLFKVRRDALVAANGRTELFFTVENITKQPQQISGEFEFLLGAGGLANRREFGAARGGWIAAHDTIVVEPGEQARLRTWFEARSPGALRVTDWTTTSAVE